MYRLKVLEQPLVILKKRRKNHTVTTCVDNGFEFQQSSVEHDLGFHWYHSRQIKNNDESAGLAVDMTTHGSDIGDV